MISDCDFILFYLHGESILLDLSPCLLSFIFNNDYSLVFELLLLGSLCVASFPACMMGKQINHPCVMWEMDEMLAWLLFCNIKAKH